MALFLYVISHLVVFSAAYLMINDIDLEPATEAVALCNEIRGDRAVGRVTRLELVANLPREGVRRHEVVVNEVGFTHGHLHNIVLF